MIPFPCIKNVALNFTLKIFMQSKTDHTNTIRIRPQIFLDISIRLNCCRKYIRLGALNYQKAELQECDLKFEKIWFDFKVKLSLYK